MGTVTLTAAAPQGGWTVKLSATHSAAVSVPATVTVPDGKFSITFAVTTSAVTQQTTSTITAADSLSHASAKLTLLVDSIASLSLSPSTVVGGVGSVGTVTLTSPAPAGGWKVTLSATGDGVVVPASLTVPAGATTATFKITTQPVTQTTNSTITAADSLTSKTAVLTVTG